jgi:Uma2 family endonuclease
MGGKCQIRAVHGLALAPVPGPDLDWPARGALGQRPPILTMDLSKEDWLKRAIPSQPSVLYPESDGKPMGETDFHRKEIIDLLVALEERYSSHPDVYVAGDLFLYDQQGDPRSVICPDVFVVFGVPRGNRRVYKLWEEGRAPSLVIEVTSLSTREEDLGLKRERYARLGVEEYFLHDPFAEYLAPSLQGFYLVGGRYRPIAPATDGSLPSAVTGLVLRTEGEALRLFEAATGERLLTVEEMRDAWREAEAHAARAQIHAAQAEVQAMEAEARAEAAEEELARLRRELAGRDERG